MKWSKSGNRDERETSDFHPAPPKHHRRSRFVWFLLWNWIAAMAAIILICGVILSLPFSFTHGWSVGWPFGLSQRIVRIVCITVYYSLMHMTAAAAHGAIVVSIFALFGMGERGQFRVYCWWLRTSRRS